MDDNRSTVSIRVKFRFLQQVKLLKKFVYDHKFYHEDEYLMYMENLLICFFNDIVCFLMFFYLTLLQMSVLQLEEIYVCNNASYMQ